MKQLFRFHIRLQSHVHPGHRGDLRLEVGKGVPYLRRVPVGGVYGVRIQPVIILSVHGERVSRLPQIGYARHRSRLAPRLRKDRKQNGGKDRYYRDYDEQFDKGKTPELLDCGG